MKTSLLANCSAQICLAIVLGVGLSGCQSTSDVTATQKQRLASSNQNSNGFPPTKLYKPNILGIADPASVPIKASSTKFSSIAYGVGSSPRVSTSSGLRKGGGRYHVGKSYVIKGKRYYPKLNENYRATGLASWYGPNFHGRLTANGEIYDQNSLSAAHPTMPLPSYAKVTNLENGASVNVRVNDRGPFAHNRIIDLSARAAKLLDYTHKGVTKVRVEYVGKAPLHGLDDKTLLSSYNYGKINPASIPKEARDFAENKVVNVNPIQEALTPSVVPIPSDRPISTFGLPVGSRSQTFY